MASGPRSYPPVPGATISLSAGGRCHPPVDAVSSGSLPSRPDLLELLGEIHAHAAGEETPPHPPAYQLGQHGGVIRLVELGMHLAPPYLIKRLKPST